MSWASSYIEDLKAGKTVQFRPRGNSMSPKIESGQLVTVAPVDTEIKKDDIVLCNVKGHHYVHLVYAIGDGGFRYQIGNNKGYINGWIKRDKIYGRVTKVEK